MNLQICTRRTRLLFKERSTIDFLWRMSFACFKIITQATNAEEIGQNPAIDPFGLKLDQTRSRCSDPLANRYSL